MTTYQTPVLCPVCGKVIDVFTCPAKAIDPTVAAMLFGDSRRAHAKESPQCRDAKEWVEGWNYGETVEVVNADDLCPNGCGQPGPHFVPPSLGEKGFFHCEPLVKPKKQSVLEMESYPQSFPIRNDLKADRMHREFVIYPSTLLTRPSLPVQPEEMPLLTDEFVKEMVQLCIYRHGYSVAGVQVGMLRRFFVFSPHHSINGGKPYPALWVNPRIIETSKETVYAMEGCLSMMGGTRKEKHLVNLKRPQAVVVECDGTDGMPWRFGCDGLMSRVVQHEIDHLDGQLFTGRLNPIEFEKMRPLLRVMVAEERACRASKAARG